MPRAARTCNRCPAIIATGSTCPACTAKARAHSDRQRRPHGNPYGRHGHRAFRRAVLARDPVCVLCGKAWSTVADHHPVSRRDLEAADENVNDPRHGRGLCKPCHDAETARLQPGGWAANRRLDANRTDPRG